MLLRWLVNQYVAPAARQHLQTAAAEALRGAAAPRGEDAPQTGDGGELAPPCDLAVIFALGIESCGTVDLLQDAVTARVGSYTEHAGILAGKEAVVVETGIGATSAAEAAADVIEFHRPLWVVSAGFAGALVGTLPKGHVLIAGEVARPGVDPLSVGIQMNVEGTHGLHIGRLLTVDRIVRTRREKELLGREHQALACDMETYAIAEVCRQKGVRFVSVRIISDALEDELPKEVARLLAQKTVAGKLGAAAQAIWKRPGSALDFLKLQDEALRASDRLARFLASMVGQLGG